MELNMRAQTQKVADQSSHSDAYGETDATKDACCCCSLMAICSQNEFNAKCTYILASSFSI